MCVHEATFSSRVLFLASSRAHISKVIETRIFSSTELDYETEVGNVYTL
jgi:hypothetical protein